MGEGLRYLFCMLHQPPTHTITTLRYGALGFVALCSRVGEGAWELRVWLLSDVDCLWHGLGLLSLVSLMHMCMHAHVHKP